MRILQLILSTNNYFLLISLSLSAGNTLRGHSMKQTLIGLSGLVFFVLLPTFVPFDFAVLETGSPSNEESSWDELKNHPQVLFFRIIQNLFAITLFIIQMMNVVRIIKPTIKSSSNRIVSYLFTRGMFHPKFGFNLYNYGISFSFCELNAIFQVLCAKHSF